MSTTKPGLYANIHAKQDRIAHGSGETMRKAGSDGAPTKESFEASAKSTAAAKKAKVKTVSAPAKKAAASKKAAARP